MSTKKIERVQEKEKTAGERDHRTAPRRRLRGRQAQISQIKN